MIIEIKTDTRVVSIPLTATFETNKYLIPQIIHAPTIFPNGSYCVSTEIKNKISTFLFFFFGFTFAMTLDAEIEQNKKNVCMKIKNCK